MAYATADFSYRALPHPHPLEELSVLPVGRSTCSRRRSDRPRPRPTSAWLRAVQYYGEHRRSDMRFTRMEHVFDILTSLAPGFLPAYVFGAFCAGAGRAELPRRRAIDAQGHRGQSDATDGSRSSSASSTTCDPAAAIWARRAEYFEQASRSAGRAAAGGALRLRAPEPGRSHGRLRALGRRAE